LTPGADVFGSAARFRACDVTVVVVVWRSGETLDACLSSVLGPAGQSTHPAEERPSVLVVDNAADAPTQDVLRRWEEQVAVLRTGANLGFAGGVAAALDVVGTPAVLLLNDDATLAPGALALLLAAQREAGERCAGVQAAVVLHGTAPALTNSTGGMVTPDGFGYDRDWLRPWPVDRPASDARSPCAAPARCCRWPPPARWGASTPRCSSTTRTRTCRGGSGWRATPSPGARRRWSTTVTAAPRARGPTCRCSAPSATGCWSWPGTPPGAWPVRQWLRAPLTVASWALRTPPATARTAVRLRPWAPPPGASPRRSGGAGPVPPRVPRAEVEALLTAAPGGPRRVPHLSRPSAARTRRACVPGRAGPAGRPGTRADRARGQTGHAGRPGTRADRARGQTEQAN
jgi:hypothetical protein